jgi:signal transduction histidine kinase
MVKELDVAKPKGEVNPTKANILIVDDRQPNLLALEALLAPLGENIVLAASGRDALRHLLQSSFAVILMDVQMPELDGFETASLIRERETSRHIPIIFITALNTDQQFVTQGYSVGAVDYITKPFDPSALISKVSVFVELFKKEQLLREQTRLLHEAELEALRMKQREQEQRFEQEKILAVNRMLEERVQERTAELEAFCYSVSHDLRAPLRSINSYSFILEEDADLALSDTSIQALRKIAQATKKMDELILGLLSLSRITRTEMTLLDVDITGLCVSILDELQATDPSRKARFRVEEALSAYGDPILIRSLLWNLLENAWKFSSKRSETVIEVGAYLDDSGARVYSVRDNGVGFNQEYHRRLFKPFERLHPGEVYPGNGIGLASVLRIVKKHGGKAWVKSQEDQGTQVFFTLQPNPVAEPEE